MSPSMTRSLPDDPILIHAYLDGELDPVDALEMQRRIAADPALAAECVRVEALRQLMRERLPQILSRRRARSQGAVIVTPHPGEMSRLLATSSDAVQDDRLGAVRTFCLNHAATLVLKGAGTIVAEARRTAFNTSGNPGMASPGMGDVLTGIVAAFAARVSDPFIAACLGVHVHGLAADVRAQQSHGPGYLAREVADSVPGALALLGAGLQ